MQENIYPLNKKHVEYMSDIAIQAKAHWGYDQVFMDACRAELTYTETCIENLVASYGYWCEEQLAGFYALSQLTCKRLEMEALFVLPTHMGLGIGKALFSHAVKQLTAFNCIYLEIHADPNAAPFYQKMHCIQTGQTASESIEGRMLPTYQFTSRQHIDCL